MLISSKINRRLVVLALDASKDARTRASALAWLSLAGKWARRNKRPAMRATVERLMGLVGGNAA